MPHHTFYFVIQWMFPCGIFFPLICKSVLSIFAIMTEYHSEYISLVKLVSWGSLYSDLILTMTYNTSPSHLSICVPVAHFHLSPCHPKPTILHLCVHNNAPFSFLITVCLWRCSLVHSVLVHELSHYNNGALFLFQLSCMEARGQVDRVLTQD